MAFYLRFQLLQFCVQSQSLHPLHRVYQDAASRSNAITRLAASQAVLQRRDSLGAGCQQLTHGLFENLASCTRILGCER
jgi:hypothetical protein